MSFLGSTEKKVAKGSVLEKLILGVLAIFVVSALIPILTEKIAHIAAELTNSALALAPKVAIASALVGTIVFLSPWHAHHGFKLVRNAAGCAFAASLIPTVFLWISTQGPNIAAGALNAASVIGHSLQGIGG
ncbi:MAG: hypothetical protein ACREP9_02035 [Candidatus Dormibacteraceae bacterium]